MDPGALDENDLIKLAITDEYCRELSIPVHKLSSKMVPEPLIVNLCALIEYSICVSPADDTRWQHFCYQMNVSLSKGRTIKDSPKATGSQLSLPQKTASDRFHAGLWNNTISIGLRRAWVMSQPAHPANSTWISSFNTARHSLSKAG